MIQAKDKPRWTHWEQLSYVEGWKRLVQHEMVRLWRKGEMKLDDGLKRWCGLLPHRNGDERAS